MPSFASASASTSASASSRFSLSASSMPSFASAPSRFPPITSLSADSGADTGYSLSADPHRRVGWSALRPAVSLPDEDGGGAAVEMLYLATKGDVPQARHISHKLQKAGMTLEDAELFYGKHGSPLHFASAAGQVAMCRYLLRVHKMDVNATDMEGATPLMFAVQGTGSLEVVQILLDYGSNINQCDNGGITPLHLTAEKGLYEIAELLLSRGAEVNLANENGEIPLHIAAESGNADVMKLLLDYDSDLNKISLSLYTPCTASVIGPSLVCLQNLVEAGAEINMPNAINPLVLAAENGLIKCVKYLLNAGANADVPNEDGQVPLLVAAKKGWTGCMKLLFPVTTRLAGYSDWSIDAIYSALNEKVEGILEGKIRKMQTGLSTSVTQASQIQGLTEKELKDMFASSASEDGYVKLWDYMLVIGRDPYTNIPVPGQAIPYWKASTLTRVVILYALRLVRRIHILGLSFDGGITALSLLISSMGNTMKFSADMISCLTQGDERKESKDMSSLADALHLAVFSLQPCYKISPDIRYLLSLLRRYTRSMIPLIMNNVTLKNEEGQLGMFASLIFRFKQVATIDHAKFVLMCKSLPYCDTTNPTDHWKARCSQNYFLNDILNHTPGKVPPWKMRKKFTIPALLKKVKKVKKQKQPPVPPPKLGPMYQEHGGSLIKFLDNCHHVVDGSVLDSQDFVLAPRQLIQSLAKTVWYQGLAAAKIRHLQLAHAIGSLLPDFLHTFQEIMHCSGEMVGFTSDDDPSLADLVLVDCMS